MQFGLNLKTVVCSTCGFVFTNPMPSRQVYEDFYTTAYAAYYGGIAAPGPGDKTAEEPANVRKWLTSLERIRPLQGARLLEVGPGNGNFLGWAKRRGCEVLGVEPSEAFCRALQQAGLPHQRGSLLDVAPATLGTFDVVAMFHVLEHFYDPNAALEHCRELLAENGLLIVEVPNILKPFRSLDRYFIRYVHPSSFSPATLKAMLHKFGFGVIQCDDGGSDWHAPQNLFAVARKLPKLGSEPNGPVQDPEALRRTLRSYRTRWDCCLSLAWHTRAAYHRARRAARRLLPNRPASA